MQYLLQSKPHPGFRHLAKAQIFRQLFHGSTEKEDDGLEYWREQYKSYKERYVKHLLFDPKKPNLSKQCMLLFAKENNHLCFSAVIVEHAPLEELRVFFDTATFDEIERDVKVNTATIANNSMHRRQTPFQSGVNCLK